MLPLRDENPTELVPFVTVLIIALNALVWLFVQQAGSGQAFVASLCQWGAIPAEITGRLAPGATVPFGPRQACRIGGAGPVTMLTSMFLHGGWMHIAGNMWFLWVFGNNIEDSMGHLRFVVFYLLCGILAAAAHILSSPGSPVPTVGASGAISGIMGAYLVLYPRVRVHTLLFLLIFVRVVLLPAWILLLLWFGLQLLSGTLTAGAAGGGVAFWAHVGGFVAGVVLIKLFARSGGRRRSGRAGSYHAGNSGDSGHGDVVLKRWSVAILFALLWIGPGLSRPDPARAAALPSATAILQETTAPVAVDPVALPDRRAAEQGRDLAAEQATPRRASSIVDVSEVQEPLPIRIARGLLALAVLLVGLWAFSTRRSAIDWGLVAKGLGLQLVFALLVLKTDVGRGFFSVVNDVFTALIGYTNAGARFVFGSLVERTIPLDGGGGTVTVAANFAFSVLPTIIFFSSLMTILYYFGVMQKVVKAVAWLMQRTLRTSGAETTSAAGNIFVGQTEAPLLIKPFVARMTMSELNTVMVGGFATVAGGVMAAYVAMLATWFPTIAGHLLAASIMAAPAGIVVSKMLYPEIETPETRDSLDFELEEQHVNAIDAAAGGATDGLRLALNVGAALIAFLALIALFNGMLGWGLGLVGVHGITLERILGWLFAPVAWLIGVPRADITTIGSLFGIKMVANEFVAFQELATILSGGSSLSPKSVIIATYALTGFANFSSIAIQIGGIGGIAPERRHDLSKLGLRAMLGGTLATWMTAALAGVLA